MKRVVPHLLKHTSVRIQNAQFQEPRSFHHVCTSLQKLSSSLLYIMTMLLRRTTCFVGLAAKRNLAGYLATIVTYCKSRPRLQQLSAVKSIYFIFNPKNSLRPKIGRLLFGHHVKREVFFFQFLSFE
jgi:hypothetical protein